MLNFAILKNPINWVIVFLMLFIASMFGTYLYTYFTNTTTQAA